MKDKLIIFLKHYPLFLYLLTVFFVLHGCAENYDFIPVKDALLLTVIYIGVSLVLLVSGQWWYRDWLKSALVSFSLMAFHFFFGSIQDGLRQFFPHSFLSKYVFLLPVLFSLLLFIIIYLKRRKKPLNRIVSYLNILFILLIIMDGIWLTGKVNASSKRNNDTLPAGFKNCPDCPRPDIYLIMADEYAGDRELKNIFQFDNSSFYQELDKRGFHIIPNSSSNYNFTPYSIASTLNMNYLDPGRIKKQAPLAYAYQTIQNNSLLNFLEYQQYRFYNYSSFDFKGQPTYTQETFLPNRTRLITSQTFLSRIQKELRFLLVTKLSSQKEIRKEAYFNRNNNQRLYELTLHRIEEKSNEPKFVFTHLMMPHYPYYFDKKGNEYPFESLLEGNQGNREHYLEYLQYSNKKLLALIDHILLNTQAPPIIILMGDHGFRHFNEAVDPSYYFCNLVSIHLPDRDYSAFRDSLTNVNFLRTVLNTSFGQQMPYLKDTAIIMDNP